ncbi:MAG: aminopeptidase, partial [Proteobacteria bacterium]
MMLWHVARFEWRFQRKSPIAWVGFVLFFLLAFGSIVSDGIQIGGSSNVHKNAPYAIAQTTAVLGIFFLFISVAMIAGVIVRDEETRFAPLLRSTSLGRFDYLVGRFVGATGMAFVVLASVPLAIALASFTPWVDSERLGPQRLVYYAYALFVLGLPTLLVVGATFFALATATRSMMACYVGAVALLVLYIASRGLLREPAYDTWSALSDPFGLSALAVTTKYWTVADKNSLVPPMHGLLLANRVLWLAIAALSFAGTLVFFRFEAKAEK